MRSKNDMMHRLKLFLLAMLLPVPLLAQDVVEEIEEPEIRRYAVEIIIFRYAQDVAAGSEEFLPDEPEEPVEDDAIEILEDLEVPEPVEEDPLLVEEEPEPLPDIEMVLIEEEDYELVELFEQLERLDAYEPLMHFGWSQATWPEEQTAPIPLALFGLPPEGLEGTLTLYLSRYLHLVVDLALQKSAATDEESLPPPVEYADGRYGDDYWYDPEEALQDLPVFFRIQENRIVRNGELRYFDHPKLGVLAKVTRVEEEEETEDGELLGYPLQ